MADDKQKIEQGVQLYFDSMYESDPAKVRAAFHPYAMITGYLETGLAEMTVAITGRSTELAHPDHQRVVEHAAILQVADQRCRGLVHVPVSYTHLTLPTNREV